MMGERRGHGRKPRQVVKVLKSIHIDIISRETSRQRAIKARITTTTPGGGYFLVAKEQPILVIDKVKKK